MWITQRAAARALAELGLARAQARELLVGGLAGPGRRVPGAVLYEADRVHDLAARPFVDDRTLSRICPSGLYVARLARGVAFDCAGRWSVRARTLRVQPPMPPLTRALVAARITAVGAMPWVVTVSGLVVFGAEATGVHRGEGAATMFDLDPPGPWFDLLDGCWLPTGRGRPWLIREALGGRPGPLQE